MDECSMNCGCKASARRGHTKGGWQRGRTLYSVAHKPSSGSHSAFADNGLGNDLRCASAALNTVPAWTRLSATLLGLLALRLRYFC
jgi:hypothetical protein